MTAPSVRIVPGQIETKTVITRMVIPSITQPAWKPFQRFAESVASRERRFPAHAHEREEVLTYVVDGFASHTMEGGATELMGAGSARFLTSALRTVHSISPARGGSIRWVSLVVALPSTASGPVGLQSVGPEVSPREEDNALVRSLVGPPGPIKSLSGLECQEIAFAEDSTTFRRVGRDRRGLVYFLSGRGSVDEHSIESGEAALIEGVPGIALRGSVGARALVATAPIV